MPEEDCRSVQTQAELLYKAPLPLNLAEREGTKFRGTEIACLLMKIRDCRGEARLIHRCFEGIVKRCNDGCVHAFWTHKTVCALHHDIDAVLGQCRNGWPVAGTLRSRKSQAVEVRPS